MRRLIGIEFTKMRRYPATWIVVLISLGQGILYACHDQYASNIASHPEAEYIIYTYSTARWFCMAAVFLTAYVIAGDFSMRTVLNVLSAGIDKRKYYFSRLVSVMLFFWGLFVCGNVVYVVTRIFFTGKVNTTLSLSELLILLFVMSLQVVAYVAIAAMISTCCKKQPLAILVGEIYLFFVMMLRLYLAGEEYYTNPDYQLHGLVTYEPMFILETVDQPLVIWDSLFSFGFLKYALSALLIILVASVIGYILLQHSDLS